MLLLVDKPKGYTSFDVIRKLKKLYPKEKIGHSGTLDPMATGLLIIGIGKDTKKLADLQKLDKQYLATIDLSKSSDTWDMDFWDKLDEYEIIEKDNNKFLKIQGKEIQAPTIENIKEKLDLLIPNYELPLPGFSAKKKGGKKLYDLARKGEQIEEYRDMKVYNYEILDYNFPYLQIKVNVGSGTYIRSIAYWLGKEFGLGGLLCKLERTSIGDYQI